jgi:hypothetical protein
MVNASCPAVLSDGARSRRWNARLRAAVERSLPGFLDPAGPGLVKKAHQNKKLELSSDPIRIEIVLATAER